MKKIKWFIPLLFTGMLIFGGGFIKTFLPSIESVVIQRVYADDEDKDKDAIDSSLYAKASDIANAFNQGLSALGSEKDEDVEKANKLLDLVRQNPTSATNVGNAGGALGYADNPTGFVSLGTKLKNWIISKVSANSSAYSYKGLANVTLSPNNDEGGNSVKTSSFIGYALYGKALTENGYMKMGDSSIIGTVIQFGRVIGGMIILVLYMINLIIPVLFAIVLKLMLIFNPFVWLARGADVLNSATGGILKQAISTDIPGAEFFGGIVESFNGLYAALTTAGIISIVFLLMFLIAGVFIFGKIGGVKSRFVKIVLRLFIIVIGIPLIGGTYTSTLQWLQKEAADSGASGYVNYIIASSFIRVDSWVENTRLAPPTATGSLATNPGSSLIKYDPQHMVASRDTQDLRRVAAAINVIAADGDAGGTNANSWASILRENLKGASSKASDGLSSYQSASNYGNEKASLSNDSFTADIAKAADSSAVSWVVDTLFKFMGSTKYTAASYDSFVKGTIHSKEGLKAANGLLSLNFKILDNVGDWTKEGSGDTAKGSTGYILYDGTGIKGLGEKGGAGGEGDEGKAFAKGYTARKYNFYNNGFLSVTPTGNGFMNSSQVSYYLKSGGAISNGSWQTSHIDTAANRTGFGLSDLAMYNFLNTAFDGSGMTVYSPSNSTSMLSLGQYQTVVMPGRGFDVFMLWLETTVILLVFVIVGVLFWYEMVTKVFFNFFGLLTNIFGTALGSLNFFMKMVLYAGAGLIQLVTAMVAYLMITQILMGVVTMSSKLAANAAITLPLGVVNLPVGATIGSALARILAIFLLLAIAFSARYVYKKHVAGAIMEFFTELITKFTHRLDRSQGGDGSVGQKIQLAGDQHKKDMDKSDYQDALAQEKALDLEDRRQGKQGRSNAELRAAARAKALQTKAARLNDIAHGRTSDHALSSEKELQDSRKDQLSQRKDETNEYRRNSREIGRNSKLLQSRDSSIAAEVAKYNKDVKGKGFTSLDQGYGDVDGDGNDMDPKTISDEDAAARAGIGDYDDLYKANTELSHAESQIRGRMSKKQDERAELMKTRAGKRMELEAVQKSHAQVEGRLANAMQSRDKAQVAYDEALATGNDAMVDAAKGRLDSAVANVAKFEQQLQDSQNDVNAAEKEVEAVDLQLDANNEAIAADDAELDAIRGNKVIVRRAAKHLARKNGFQSNVAGEQQQITLPDGSKGSVKVFKGDPDRAFSDLTKLRNSMIEGDALNSQYRAVKESDPVGAQRIYQQLQQNSQQRAESVQNLAQMGFDVERLTNLEQVNEVGQAFEQEFNTVSNGQGSVVVSGNTQARSITPYGRPNRGPVEGVKAELFTPQNEAPASFVNGHQQQVASLYGVTDAPTVTRTINAQGGPQSNDTRRTVRARQETRVISGDASVGVDHVDVVSDEHVSHQVLGGHSPRRTITNNVQGSRVVQAQPTSMQSANTQPNVTVGGNRYAGPAPIRQQASVSRDFGTTTISTDTTEFVQGGVSDTHRTIRNQNNVRVQEQGRQGVDRVDVQTDNTVQHGQSKQQARRTVVRKKDGQQVNSKDAVKDMTYGPKNRVHPAPLSRKPKK